VSVKTAELEEWRGSQKRETAWFADVHNLQRSLLCAVTILGILLVVYGISCYRQLPGLPRSVVAEGSLLSLKDGAGRVVWTHTFETPLLEYDRDPSLQFRLQDLDGDGEPETIGVWTHNLRDSQGWSVQAFAADGRERWKLKMDDRVRNLRGQEFGPPYVVRDLLIFDSPQEDGTKWTAVVFVHVADVPATLVVVDAKGQRRGQYWHSGHLNTLEMLDADGDGSSELIAAGVRHGAEQAVLVAFDPRQVGGSNPMPANHPQTITGLGPSTEKWAAYFARSEVSKRSGPFNYVSDLSIVNGRLRAHIYERIATPEAYLLYLFDPGPKPAEITQSAAFLAALKIHEIRQRFDANFPEQELARLRREFRVERGR
jgi:hypothetical protein